MPIFAWSLDLRSLLGILLAGQGSQSSMGLTLLPTNMAFSALTLTAFTFTCLISPHSSAGHVIYKIQRKSKLHSPPYFYCGSSWEQSSLLVSLKFCWNSLGHMVDACQGSMTMFPMISWVPVAANCSAASSRWFLSQLSACQLGNRALFKYQLTVQPLAGKLR